MTLHKLTELYIKWFSVCPNITSKFRITAIFKSSVEENNDAYKLVGMYIHYLSVYKTSLVLVPVWIDDIEEDPPHDRKSVFGFPIQSFMNA
jgi:hypothetical protein